MQAAYAQKNGYEALDRGTRAGAGSGSGSKGTLGPQRSGPPTPRGRPRGPAAADGVGSLQVRLLLVAAGNVSATL